MAPLTNIEALRKALQSAAWWPAIPVRVRNAFLVEGGENLPNSATAADMLAWCDSTAACRIPNVGAKSIDDTRKVMQWFIDNTPAAAAEAAATQQWPATEQADVADIVALPPIDPAYLDAQIAAARDDDTPQGWRSVD